MVVAVGLISCGSDMRGSWRVGTCVSDGSTYSQTWPAAAVDFTTSSHSTLSFDPLRITEEVAPVVVEDAISKRGEDAYNRMMKRPATRNSTGVKSVIGIDSENFHNWLRRGIATNKQVDLLRRRHPGS